MRLFIAFDVSEEIKREAAKAQDALSSFRLSFSRMENIHLTLKFLGECDEEMKTKVIDRLKQVDFSTLQLKLQGKGVFPNEKFIRVLWLGIAPEDQVIALQKKIDASLESLFPKSKDFKSHITLARVPFLPQARREELLKTFSGLEAKEISFSGQEFKLFKSTLTPQGPIYEELAVFPAKT